MALAPLPIGFLFILAIASLGVYGIVLAGWSSNNKYSLLGGLRSSAQMISYEIAMGMSTIPVLLLAGNVSLSRDRRAAGGSGLHWNVINCTVAFFFFMVAAFAETNRLPFDLPEAESELIAGYHSEYSAMKFSMFFIAEYANMMTASALMATLFFGGWDIPFTLWDNVGAAHVPQDAASRSASSGRRSCSSSSSSSGSAGRCRASATTSSWRSAGSSCCRRRSAYIVVDRDGDARRSSTLGIHPRLVAVLARHARAERRARGRSSFGILDRGRLISPAYSRLDKRESRQAARRAVRARAARACNH